MMTISESVLLYITFSAAAIALVYALFAARFVAKQPAGTKKMQKIAGAIRVGAITFLKSQYLSAALFFTIVFLGLCLMSYSFGYLSGFVPFAFISGAFLSGLAGYLGMNIATIANVRTAQGAATSLNRGLRIAFSSGTVMGMLVVGLVLFFLSVWFWVLRFAFNIVDLRQITAVMLTLGMGASTMALFARVGGGIFTKAADVGADLVGKVERNIPEDDPRNPAVIADNVGDNVGDVAGMGADLYESYLGSIVAAMALGVAAFASLGQSLEAIVTPLLLACVGVIASILGAALVRTNESATQKDLLNSFRRGTLCAAFLVIVAAYFLVNTVLPGNLGIFFAIVSGLVAGIVIGFTTDYYTSDHYPPTKFVASQSSTPATLIIAGLSKAMESTAIPVLTVTAAILAAYFFAGGASSVTMGLYGISISAVGMLSTLGITLATDAYGPVADNAGGIAEMAGMKKIVRERTDALDMLGNTTAATGKGFAIGSAALTTLALISAYREEIMLHAPDFVFKLEIVDITVMAGLFIGAVLPFVFGGITMLAVGRAAEKIVIEVRRQFNTIKGIMSGKAEPDYESCVKIATIASQKEMILPAIIAITAPIAVGLLLGPSGVVAMLISSLVTGFILAIFMANAGGSWDNAKKHIEAGNYGGKGSEAHKSGVVADTVGDPLKDTSGPSINILLKLMSMVSIVFAGFVVANYIRF